MNEPPVAFGLAWKDEGPVWVRGNLGGRIEKRLFVAEGTPEWRRAHEIAGFELRQAGFGGNADLAKFWAWDGIEERLQSLYMSRAAEALAKADDKDRQKAAWAAEEATRRLETLRVVVQTQWFAVHGDKIVRARELAERKELTPAEASEALMIVINAERAVLNARKKMSAHESVEQDPERRAVAHAAIRFLASLDTDRAALDNGRGFGRTTSIPGHVLAAEETLPPAQAAHALDILREHRRQLPAETRSALGLA